MDTPLNDEVALRIGLAAKELESVETKALLALLIHIMGEPITAAKINKLRAKKLRSEAGELFDGISPEIYERAFALLKGRGIRQYLNPRPQYEPGTFCEINNSLRVACASNRGEYVDGEFSECIRFLIYQVSPEYIRLIDMREPSAKVKRGDKHKFRAKLIEDCSIVYTTAIGAMASAQIVKLGLHPIKLEFACATSEVLERLQSVLAKPSPPPWLAKAMGKPNLGIKLYGEQAL